MKLLKPSFQTFAFFWPWFGFFALLAWKPETWVAVLGLGFVLGYMWAYLRIFKQMNQVFGKERADKIWTIFRGY